MKWQLSWQVWGLDVLLWQWHVQDDIWNEVFIIEGCILFHSVDEACWWCPTVRFGEIKCWHLQTTREQISAALAVSGNARFGWIGGRNWCRHAKSTMRKNGTQWTIIEKNWSVILRGGDGRWQVLQKVQPRRRFSQSSQRIEKSAKIAKNRSGDKLIKPSWNLQTDVGILVGMERRGRRSATVNLLIWNLF